MAKLYFKYGAMGSSKTAQALITKFNYEERGMKVWLIKPATDTRDGIDTLASRAGLSAKCRSIGKNENILDLFKSRVAETDVIIADESQFFTENQIDELREIVNEWDVPVLCFGLRTDFLTRLFPGSKRLLEIADTLSEIKTMCDCGRKATVSARIDGSGKIVTAGRQVVLGGNDRYVAMCHTCFVKRIREEQNNANQ
ncbi:MAG: thymidine kinase [Ruminococcaceae bacterium]|nr:thymidine kinase [Oscillospiraceae bacterium]